MNNPFLKYKIFILLIFTLSFGVVSCNGGNPALNTTWSLTKLVSVGEPLEDSSTETVEIKNCGIPIEKTTDCSAGTSSDLTLSTNGGGAFGVGTQFTVDAGVGATLGIGRGSGQSVKLETPPNGFIYTYTVIKNYRVINGEAVALSSNQEEKVFNYSFHASCSIDIISKEQTSCSGNNLTPTQTSPSSVSGINVYDTFDNSKYDGSINQSLWLVNPDDNMTLFQDNTKLVLQASNPKDYGTLWINPLNGDLTNLQSYNAIEAKFSWEPEIKNKLYLGLTVQQSWTPQRLYACDFILSDTSSFLHCSGTDNEQTHSPNDVSIVPNRVYTLRFEIDPKTAVFIIYLDNSVIDTYEPPNPDQWLQGPISYNVHLGTEPNSSGKSYVDDVKFGQLK